jgi:ppGpp synthetase/RelA/SpoT-type nucleotidyltranferase
MIEIQIRTSLQHVWAELSEKFSDVINPSIKYGGGDAIVQEILQRASNLIAEEELAEKELTEYFIMYPVDENTTDEERLEADTMRKEQKELKTAIYETLKRLINNALKVKERVKGGLQ